MALRQTHYLYTPVSKYKFKLKSDSISPRKLLRKVVKKLVLSNVILDEIKATCIQNPQKQK